MNKDKSLLDEVCFWIIISTFIIANLGVIAYNCVLLNKYEHIKRHNNPSEIIVSDLRVKEDRIGRRKQYDTYISYYNKGNNYELHTLSFTGRPSVDYKIGQTIKILTDDKTSYRLPKSEVQTHINASIFSIIVGIILIGLALEQVLPQFIPINLKFRKIIVNKSRVKPERDKILHPEIVPAS